ncbi:YceK/YidQ family lipoprotein [Pseudomonas sp. MAFF 302046]|uniref:YceK/YidQ family lipoprotein n=1 Tax=Pseudomonas morbosilactucae TaxID=2938197 RepID=A0ABT0J9X1_9PSED|nr:YceK/YidQ family lipoprotein [Pseudomonas morbosilactucae]MCK9812652.1 YceK/YidQ family lipoprotein [Pseudomonas morbosilactucae]
MLRNGIIKALTPLLLASLLSVAGCGTLIARTPNSSSGYDYYRGTQANVELLTMRGSSGYEGYATLFCWVTIVCPVVAIASLPVDVVADTVLLPYDAMNN